MLSGFELYPRWVPLRYALDLRHCSRNMCKVILHGTTCNKPLLATTLVSATQRCNLRCSVGTTLQPFETMSCYDRFQCCVAQKS